MTNIGINGFGRIGRNFLRAWLENPEKLFTITAVNDLTPIETVTHLLKYDSVLGRLNTPVSHNDDTIFVGEYQIKYFSEHNPENIPWAEHNVDIVVESTGFFTDGVKAGAHDARWVVISAPGKNVDYTVVMGVNDDKLDVKNTRIISNASCTTNCLAPVVKTIDDNFTVQHGTMVTVHAYTGDQNLIDGPHANNRRARSAGLNIVPTSTGAAKAVGLVLPHLQGKLDGYALRVPVPTGSIVDLLVTVEKPVTVETVNNVFKKAAETSMKNIIEYTEDEIVSSDIVSNSHSAIFDSKLTWVNDNQLKIAAWYDNEWGYSNRLLDLVNKIVKEK